MKANTCLLLYCDVQDRQMAVFKSVDLFLRLLFIVSENYDFIPYENTWVSFA